MGGRGRLRPPGTHASTSTNASACRDASPSTNRGTSNASTNPGNNASASTNPPDASTNASKTSGTSKAP